MGVYSDPGRHSATHQNSGKETMERATLRIEGMSCGHCVGHVTRTLDALDGVTPDVVEIGKAVVSYDPAIVDADTIAGAVTKGGYPAQIASVQ